MVKHKRTISFESDIDDNGPHITRDETFDTAYAMYDTLHKACPGCAMGVVSVLVSMLAIHYMKDEIKEGRIFEHEDWIKTILESSNRAINRHEKMNTSH
jgi:hypothetical protein